TPHQRRSRYAASSDGSGPGGPGLHDPAVLRRASLGERRQAVRQPGGRTRDYLDGGPAAQCWNGSQCTPAAGCDLSGCRGNSEKRRMAYGAARQGLRARSTQDFKAQRSLEESIVKVSRFVLGALLSLCPSLILAQAFPNQTIRLIVPFPAGGPNDLIARVVAQRMSEILKQ